MVKFYGAHVSVAGGFENAIANARELGVNAIQVHPSPPQRWNSKPYPEGYEKNFIDAREASEVKRVFFHAIYLVNLVTPDSLKLEKAKQSLTHYLNLSARIGGDGVVVHVGSLKDEPDDMKGYKRAAKAIDEILKESDPKSRLILEVAAGAGKVVGSQLLELRTIYDHLSDRDRVGYGLDTQHMWASGYDWQNNLDGIMEDIESTFSFDKVWCIHLNDSKTELASKKDRHENLGDGLIGETALRAFLSRSELTDIPVILETPALKDIESAKGEVQRLREYIEG
ncbi:MAG: deoxyribonuclease IV [Bdellovibrionales bacterium]|nr:deoxyribonuclease IV [Bdellovibrionales bacterium]